MLAVVLCYLDLQLFQLACLLYMGYLGQPPYRHTRLKPLTLKIMALKNDFFSWQNSP